MKYSLRQVIGLIVWWTEGSKAYKRKENKNTWVYNVEVTNTNSEIIKVFLSFLRNDVGLDESRLKLQLQIHEGDNQEEIENFWSKLTKIPKNRFTKTIVRPTGNKIGKSRGTCKVRYSDKQRYLILDSLLKDLLIQANNGV